MIVRRSSGGPIACWILARTSSLVIMIIIIITTTTIIIIIIIIMTMIINGNFYSATNYPCMGSLAAI